MKKLLVLLLAGFILCSVPLVSAEDIFQSVHIIYAGYDGMELFGQVEIPDGLFFVRATFFLPDHMFLAVVFPISREGLFELDICVRCVYASIAIVDSPCAIIPGQGTVYETAPVSFI